MMLLVLVLVLVVIVLQVRAGAADCSAARAGQDHGDCGGEHRQLQVAPLTQKQNGDALTLLPL